jgi:hypothetical protein
MAPKKRTIPVPKDIKAGIGLMEELTALRVEKREDRKRIVELERRAVIAERRATKAEETAKGAKRG